MQGRLEYNRDLFERTTIEGMAARFNRLLAAVAADPERPISRYDLVGEDESRTLLHEWNETRNAAAGSQTLVAAFERSAESTPAATAISGDGPDWSYDRLNRYANRLAQFLAGRVGRYIGVCLERTPEMVAALLAVLKAGAAYVPLDPDLPRERLAFMMADANLALVLTHSAQAAVLPDGPSRTEFVTLDHLDLSGYSEENPVRRAG